MDRKQFLKSSLCAGACWCGAAMGLTRTLSEIKGTDSPAPTPPHGWIPDLEKRMIRGSETPSWRKVEKSMQWIKNLVDHMDAMLDKATVSKLLQACGRSCYIGAFGVAPDEKPSDAEVQQVLEALRRSGSEVRQENGHTVIYSAWGRNHQNPTGLILQDGYCMCPVVENGPPGLSPSYCQCSTGYVKEGMERSLGRPVKVDLLESLKMGGRDCRFRIEVEEA